MRHRRAVMVRVALVAAGVVAGGCGGTPALLARADAAAAAEHYAAALGLYDEFLQGHADASESARARAARSVLTRLLASQDQIARIERELAARNADLERTRRELATRQAEVERLRADLARLRRIDLELQPRER